MRKGAAHGFRNLSVNKIPNTFERLITNLQTNIDIFIIKILFGFEHRIKELKTKNDIFVNGFDHGVLSQKVSGIFVKKPVPLTIVSCRKL